MHAHFINHSTTRDLLLFLRLSHALLTCVSSCVCSVEYGDKFGKSGDVIAVQLDFNQCTIEFFKNGVSQGVAFTNLTGTVFAAVSLTATGASARLNIIP